MQMTEFFAENLRFRKNEEKTPLQTCWCAATIKHFSSICGIIDSVDVVAVCDEIKNKFVETQGKARCSLYLASQLMFGVVKVYQAQTDSCLRACQNLCESFMLRAVTKKKATKKKDNEYGETKSSPAEASPKIPEIPEVDIFSLLEKDSAKDVNLIEEIDFPSDHANDLSFAFSHDAESDDAAMEEEFDRELQRTLRQEKDIPPRLSTDSPLHEKAPSIDNVQSPHIPGNENDAMDQDQMSLDENHIHDDMRRKLQETPIRKAHPILRDINESTPANVRAGFSPLASKVPSLPQLPLFMSPVLGKRKRRPLTLGRDVTIVEPIAEAALPTDSPQQSRLPMECATPPRLFSTTLGAFESPSENDELPDRQSNIQPEKEKESAIENDEAIESISGKKSSSLLADDEDSTKSLSQSRANSQKVTTMPTDNSANRRRAKKRTFQDSEKTLDDGDFAKRLKNTNYLIKKKEKVLVTSSIFSQLSAARFLLTLPCVLQKQSSISNRLMQLYQQDIQVLQKLAKTPTEPQHSSQRSGNHFYDEEESPHPSPAATVIEENVEDDDITMPKDNVLNKQRLQSPTGVPKDYVNDEDEVQDNNISLTDPAVPTSCITAQVNSSQSTVVGTVSSSASLNKENEQIFYRPASPSTSIQSNPSQLFETSQTAHINEVSKEIDDKQQENNQVLHQAKKFKAGDTEFEIDLTVQTSKTIFLSIEDFYARVKTFWNECDKLNRRTNGKVMAVFQEVVSPENSNLYEVLKYLIYCFMLERDRKMDLHQQKPWNSLYILQR
ncbi:hypothetical protein TSAR_010721 [Trichomalopsis sarcophagae]|uniref:Rad21/Rec8-like protein N-terminal domain-containing protein n=1 Tax=Trichomalopsis sarcophagae TaxID=543379 RepID=A0A232F6M6_9HYME|nr:hypothetical protein TSAR_010721 [Trichomalopsis sarcophagae]